jgi:hypothetical protein
MEGDFRAATKLNLLLLGEDWANCLVIAVQSPVHLSHFPPAATRILASRAFAASNTADPLSTVERDANAP